MHPIVDGFVPCVLPYLHVNFNTVLELLLTNEKILWLYEACIIEQCLSSILSLSSGVAWTTLEGTSLLYRIFIMLQESRQKGLKKIDLLLQFIWMCVNLVLIFLDPIFMFIAISMDWVLCKILTIHTAHEILWTMPWTPWIAMRER